MNGQGANANEPPRAARAALIVGLTAVVVLLLVVGSALLVSYFKVVDEIRLPLMVIAGLISLLGMLAVMAIGFKTVHLANATQALGLPEGTVRAVIALSLILIFAVVTVYLFSALSLCDEKSPAPAAGNAGGASQSPSPTEQQQTARNNAALDFAKQLLVMLGTLITSITSFYFGSKTGSDVVSAVSRSTPPPTDVPPAPAGAPPSPPAPAGAPPAPAPGPVAAAAPAPLPAGGVQGGAVIAKPGGAGG